jgi:hypothetical protein
LQTRASRSDEVESVGADSAGTFTPTSPLHAWERDPETGEIVERAPTERELVALEPAKRPLEN